MSRNGYYQTEILLDSLLSGANNQSACSIRRGGVSHAITMLPSTFILKK